LKVDHARLKWATPAARVPIDSIFSAWISWLGQYRFRACEVTEFLSVFEPVEAVIDRAQDRHLILKVGEI